MCQACFTRLVSSLQPLSSNGFGELKYRIGLMGTLSGDEE